MDDLYASNLPSPWPNDTVGKERCWRAREWMVRNPDGTKSLDLQPIEWVSGALDQEHNDDQA